MNIAIDYDGTYSVDPEMWKEVFRTFRNWGHCVYCVTKRYELLSSDIQKEMTIPIIHATKSKKEAVRKHGIEIDVWIDDNPASITPYKSLNRKMNR